MTFSSERDAILNQEAIEQRKEVGKGFYMCYSFSKTCDYDYEERLDRLNRLAARLIQETQDILDLQFGVIDASLLNAIEDEARTML